MPLTIFPMLSISFLSPVYSLSATITFLIVPFGAQKFSISVQSSSSVFSFVVFALGVISKKSSGNAVSISFCFMFSSKTFTVLTLTFRCLICFQLVFVHDVRSGSNFIHLHGYPVFPRPFLE